MKDKCEKCGEWYPCPNHRCEPGWLVWDEENDDRDDALTVHASDAREAVELWAERDDADSADYSIVSGNDAMALVVPVDVDGPPDRYRVCGESEPSYSAGPSR